MVIRLVAMRAGRGRIEVDPGGLDGGLPSARSRSGSSPGRSPQAFMVVPARPSVERGRLASDECSQRARTDALSRMDPFGACSALGPGLPDLYCLDTVADLIDLATLPLTVKIPLENLLRHAGGAGVVTEDVEALLAWRPGVAAEAEIPFMPARVLLQDFTGVPAVVDPRGSCGTRWRTWAAIRPR